MKLKKIFPAFSLLFILNSISVYAKSTRFLPQSFENILVFLFDTLPQGVKSESTIAIVYIKILLLIFVFAVVYSAMKKVMHDNNRVASTAAFVIALGSVMLLSNRLVRIIFEMYSTLISVLLVILPLLIFWYLGKKIFPEQSFKSSWAKGLIFVLAAMVILFLAVAITESGDSEIYTELAGWMEIAAVVLLFVGIIMFLGGAGSAVRGDYSRGRSSGDRPGGGGGRERRDRRREGSELRNESEIDNYLRRLRRIQNGLAADERLLDSNTMELDQLRRRLEQLVRSTALALNELRERYDQFSEQLRRRRFSNNREARRKLNDFEQRLVEVERQLEQLIAKLEQRIKQLIGKVEQEGRDDQKEQQIEEREADAEIRKAGEEGVEQKTETDEEAVAEETGDKGEARQARKKVETTKKRRKKTKKAVKQSIKAVRKREKVEKVERKVERDLGEELRILGQIVNQAREIVHHNDPRRTGLKSTIYGKTRKDFLENTKKIGKVSTRVFKSLSEIRKLHKELNELESHEERMLRTRQIILEKAKQMNQ